MPDVPDAAYAAVFANYVFEHLPDRTGAYGRSHASWSPVGWRSCPCRTPPRRKFPDRRADVDRLPPPRSEGSRSWPRRVRLPDAGGAARTLRVRRIRARRGLRRVRADRPVPGALPRSGQALARRYDALVDRRGWTRLMGDALPGAASAGAGLARRGRDGCRVRKLFRDAERPHFQLSVATFGRRKERCLSPFLAVAASSRRAGSTRPAACAGQAHIGPQGPSSSRRDSRASPSPRTGCSCAHRTCQAPVTPGVRSSRLRPHPSMRRSSASASGRGPTRLICPSRTLKSCGSSSSDEWRRKRPSRVMRGSGPVQQFGSLDRAGVRAALLGVGHHRAELAHREAAAALPMRVCLKKTGTARIDLDGDRDDQHHRARRGLGRRTRRPGP